MYKVIYLPEENNIVVDIMEESQEFVINDGAAMIDVVDNTLPEVPKEISDYVKANPYTSFRLHKVVDGQVVVRTVEDLQQQPYATWTRDITYLEPEEEVVEEFPELEVVPPSEEPPADEEPV